jgi:YHS domain-containing protein
MKRWSGVLLCASVSVVLAALVSVTLPVRAEEPSTRPSTRPVAGASTQPVNNTQPVNKMCAVNPDDEVDPEVPTITYKGKVVGFCCADCRKKFEKDPEMYFSKLK